MNGVNLTLFPFEGDLTWMSFFLNARDEVYARYGGREDADPESHLTKNSLILTMKRVLDLHAKGSPQAAKYQNPVEPRRTPEDVPTMASMMSNRKMKCIHCHDFKNATLLALRDRDRFTRDLVYSYPTPRSVGIVVDPDRQNRVESILPKSLAEASGLRNGDEIETVDGARILTMADFARVLEVAPRSAELPLRYKRGETMLDGTLKLSGDWRRTDDPSWRPSINVAGPNPGVWGPALSASEREKLGLKGDTLAVRVGFMPPAQNSAARRAGIEIGDVIVEFGGSRRPMTAQQIHGECKMRREFGDKVDVTVLRNGREIELVLELPKSLPSRTP